MKITPFISVLLCCAALYAQPEGDAKVSWKASVDDGGRILLEGTPASGVDHVSGSLTAIPCEGTQCYMPEDFQFDLTLSETSVASESSAAVGTEAELPQEDIPLAELIAEAILWGIAMLLTPCVFPMVPMTVSFFLKRSGNRRKGRFRALMYGLFIILLYTVPVCAVIGATWAVGGSVVTADIFNWLSTHWLPNIIFFIVFFLFALSFFGVFEITLPSKWVNGADSNSDRDGLGGVFFMALTLVMVSFSCTGPIVGTVLIKSTSGEFWTPMIVMLVFSVAFALPFVLLALFPSLLDKLPKSGGWLNTVKVSLGFIELALGLKFLSVADQTYNWGILPRNVYITIWIVLFALLLMYLLGLLRFNGDEEKVKFTPRRLLWTGVVAAFVIYLFSGLYGNPLKALSGYLPPEERAETTVAGESLVDKAAAQAAKEGKLVFVDITGYGCVNCREMESRVWTDPAVKDVLARDYVVVRLYVDDKTKLPESQWFVTPEGKVLKDVGRINSYLAINRFGVNSQPNYFILDSSGNILRGPYSYNLSVPDFLEFLKR